MNVRIKTTKEIFYKAISKFGKISPGDRLAGETNPASMFYRYNKEGEIVEEGMFSEDYFSYDKPLIICKSKHDDSGRLIEDLFFSEEKPFGVPERKVTYHYNDQGFEIAMKFFKAENSFEDKNKSVKEAKKSKPQFIIEEITQNTYTRKWGIN